MREFLKLLSKRIFRIQFERTDFLSTILTASLGAVDYFYPNFGIDMEVISWQTPLVLLALAFFLRILSAPYFLWKEQKEKYEQSLNYSGALQIGFYSKQVSFMYNDLIENWSEEGIKAHMLELKPRSFSAFFYLDEIAPSMLLSEQVRNDLKEFLSYFLVNRSILAASFPAIRTIFDNEKNVLKKKNAIKLLAEKLSLDLKNIASPRNEE